MLWGARPIHVYSNGCVVVIHVVCDLCNWKMSSITYVQEHTSNLVEEFYSRGILLDLTFYVYYIGIKNVKLYEKSIVWLTKNLHQPKHEFFSENLEKLAASMNTTTNLCYVLCGFEIVRINFKTIQVETAKSLRTVCNLCF